jgi:hypothetical protein
MKGSIINRIIVILLFFATYSSALAQFGISGGVSLLKSFRVPQSFFGFHVGGEIPRDDQLSFYGRLSYSLKQREQDSTATILYNETFTDSKEVKFVNAMNYVIIEGGNRYYIGNGYDADFGAYGGGNLMLIFNTVNREYSDFDNSKFQLPQNEMAKGSIFNLAVGLAGGVKYTFAGIGTAYFDAGLGYMILSTASNPTAESVASTLYSPLIFNFAVGFRKDLY